MEHSTNAAPQVRRHAGNRRPLSRAQKRVAPLAPIFSACKARGLKITPDNRAARLYAVNSYLCQLPEGFDWIESSFKELLGNTAAILAIGAEIEAGCLTW